MPRPRWSGSTAMFSHVPRVDVARDDQIAAQLAVFAFRFERAEADRARFRELTGEHRARPRRRVRAALDLLDRPQVAEAQDS